MAFQIGQAQDLEKFTRLKTRVPCDSLLDSQLLIFDLDRDEVSQNINWLLATWTGDFETRLCEQIGDPGSGVLMTIHREIDSIFDRLGLQLGLARLDQIRGDKAEPWRTFCVQLGQEVIGLNGLIKLNFHDLLIALNSRGQRQWKAELRLGMKSFRHAQRKPQASKQTLESPDEVSMSKKSQVAGFLKTNSYALTHHKIKPMVSGVAILKLRDDVALYRISLIRLAASFPSRNK